MPLTGDKLIIPIEGSNALAHQQVALFTRGQDATLALIYQGLQYSYPQVVFVAKN